MWARVFVCSNYRISKTSRLNVEISRKIHETRMHIENSYATSLTNRVLPLCEKRVREGNKRKRKGSQKQKEILKKCEFLFNFPFGT